MSAITRLGLYGGPRAPYGTIVVAAQITRLGLYGGPRQVYGTFTGKEAVARSGTGSAVGVSPLVRSVQQREDEELIAFAIALTGVLIDGEF